jgi:hypothetical protein
MLSKNAVAIALLVSAATMAVCIAGQEISTRELLTTSEFRACGLHKLSTKELANLNKSVGSWIRIARTRK